MTPRRKTKGAAARPKTWGETSRRVQRDVLAAIAGIADTAWCDGDDEMRDALPLAIKALRDAAKGRRR